MELSAAQLYEAVVSKIKNQYRLPARHLQSIKAKVEEIAKDTTHFSSLEVECLIRQFYILLGQQPPKTKAIQGMDKQQFFVVLKILFGVDSKHMIDYIFSTLDLNRDGYIGDNEWVQTLGVFLRGNLEEKIKYTFDVYDLNGDKSISKEEMLYMMKGGNTAKSKYDWEMEDLLDITFKAVDRDHDGFLCYPDFQQSVIINDMYLQAFGKCMPDEFDVVAFEHHLQELKVVVKARGKGEYNIPRKGCLLNCTTHLQLTTTFEKLSGFLPCAMLQWSHTAPPTIQPQTLNGERVKRLFGPGFSTSKC
ncbi:unnamed protein product [Knipowitschia caucasica]|uniref:EF-hand domain-containing protein n=1 Tax=Knipowitschia caucasica TaxID=637954 RepID=A0AAV2K0X0_KNICA